MRKKIWLLLAVILMLGGCGGNAIVSNAADPSAPPATRVMGRVELDGPLVGALVEFFTPEGAPIPTSQPVFTNEGGIFDATVQGPVDRFRAVASAGNERYASDYDGFSPTSELVMITPLTNLVAAHQDAHPELSVEQSEQAVANFLQLPEGHTIRYHMVQQGHRPGFKVGLYLAAARSDRDLVAKVLQSIDNPQAPLIPNSIFSDPTTQFWTDQSIQLGVAVVSTVLQAGGIPAGALLGWAVNLAIGGGGGDQAALQELAAEIEALQMEIDEVYNALSAEIADEAYISQVNGLIEQLSAIQTNRAILANLLNKGGKQQQLDLFVGAITDSSFIQLLDTIHTAQVGSGIAPGLQEQAAGVVQLDSGGYYGNASQYNPLLSQFSYFASQQTSAVAMIVEGLHCDSTPGTSPEISTPDPPLAQSIFDGYQQNLAVQASALPQPLDSDDVILVRQAGLLFYRKAIPRAQYGEAVFFAMIFREGNYRNWRVATATDYVALLNALNEPGFNIDVHLLERQGFDFSAATSSTDNPDDSHYYVGLDDNFIGLGFSLDVGTQELFKYSLFGGPVWGGNQLPYMLVCDVADQDPSLFPATAAAANLEIVQSGTQLSALATHDLVKGMSPNFASGTVNFTYGNSGTPIDITDLVAWGSSDPFTLRIQNPPAQKPLNTLKVLPDIILGPGVVTWFKPGTVTVTAQMVNVLFSNRPVLSATTTLTNNDVPPPSLMLLRLGPKNWILNSAPSVTNLTLFGFFNDGSSQSLSQATFTTSIPEASVVVIDGQVQLDLSAKPSVSSFTVTATIGGVSDTTTFFVNVP